MGKRILLLVVGATIAAGSLGAARLFAADSPRGLEIYAPSSEAQPAPTELPGSNDCCPEWGASNFPIPSKSDRGDHCPAGEVPEGSDEGFDPESGRIEISFYDEAFQADRTFILDVRDRACFDTRQSRRHIFSDLVQAIGIYLTGGEETACGRLRDAIRAGSLKLGEVPFDLRPARPYVGEVCQPRA